MPRLPRAEETLFARAITQNAQTIPLASRAVRQSSPYTNSTIVAMVDVGSEAHALLVGANFMIYKPVDLDHSSRCMRARYGAKLQA